MTTSSTDPAAVHLAAHLAPTPRNIASAAKAMAKLAASGWQPMGGYPGSDTLWRVKCLVCGTWEGDRFFSHLRRDKPKSRHEGCLPVDQHPDRLAKLAQKLKPECTCLFAHPTTPEGAREATDAVEYARKVGDTTGLLIHLARLLGPCPASAARAEALQALKAMGS